MLRVIVWPTIAEAEREARQKAKAPDLSKRYHTLLVTIPEGAQQAHTTNILEYC
jgi:hypothetical protein